MQYIPRPYLFISTASLPPIQKPYSLHQSPLVGGQNGIQVLGLWTFVVEEFGDKVPDYLNILDLDLDGRPFKKRVYKIEKRC